MDDGAHQRTCPKCGRTAIVRFSKSKQEWLWETHRKTLDKPKECSYSNTSKGIK